MRTIHVERTIAAPPEQVFELLSDHANYKRFPLVTGSELLREGDKERNGAGALRKVSIGPLRFEEEITEFEPPVRMSYVIRKVNIPFEHQGGTITLEPTDAGTHVIWRSTFRVPLRLVGGVVAAVDGAVFGSGFSGMLRDVDRTLTS